MIEYKLVPVEPTIEMAFAGIEVYGIEECADADVHSVWEAMLTAAPAVQGEPVEFCEDAALSIAEQTFSTEVDEQLANDIIQYAQRLRSLYAAPKREEQRPAPDAALLEAFDAGRRAAQAEAADLAGALDGMIEAADVASWGGYFPTAAVTRAVEALAAYRKQGGES